MIDPFNITDYDRSDADLEEFILFSVAVAGKQANRIAKNVDNLLKTGRGGPFQIIAKLVKNNKLRNKLEEFGFGQYDRICKAYQSLVSNGIDLRSCSVDELENIHGIGPKTSRFFVLHSRKEAEVAALDTHCLKYLRDLGYAAPKTTPTGRRYKELEKIFIEQARKNNMSVADFDLAIWKRYTKTKPWERK